MRTFVIGDVHGCYETLMALLDKIDFSPQSDKLCFVGDLVNRGPKSLKVLEFIYSLPNYAITLGNHDLHLLAVDCGTRSLNDKDTFEDVLISKKRRILCDWLREQPLLHYFPEHHLAMVHAGIPPQWNMATALKHSAEVEHCLRNTDYKKFLSHLECEQPNSWSDTLQSWPRMRIITNYFTYMRYCTEHGVMDFSNKSKPEKLKKNGLQPWFRYFHQNNPDLKIAFGHWSSLEGHTSHSNIIATDTGCVWKKHLTAYWVEKKMKFFAPYGE